MNNFADKLLDAVKRLDNPTVAGLDTRLEFVPECVTRKYFKENGNALEAACEAIFEFNKGIIDALSDVVAAIKPQLAYYEMYGAAGIAMFQKTVEYAKAKGMLVIADGKRNDIGSTSEAYSSAFLGRTYVNGARHPAFDADALTVNPYLGGDGLDPFFADCASYGKGVFVLVKTSNKSSIQIQDQKLMSGETVYMHVARLVDEWGERVTGDSGYSSIGAVVGATWPEEAKILRELMPKNLFLVPGYGAQGGSAAAAALCFDNNGRGAVVNASRSILCAYKSEMWKDKFSSEAYAEAARAETEHMRDELNAAISEKCKG